MLLLVWAAGWLGLRDVGDGERRPYGEDDREAVVCTNQYLAKRPFDEHLFTPWMAELGTIFRQALPWC